MNTIKEEKYREWRKIDGEDILVKSMLTMEYTGIWRGYGYNVVWKEKEIRFFGYPTDSDIRRRFGLTKGKK